MYSCVPANERRQRDVEGVLEDLLAPSPGWPGPPRPRRRSASCRASSRRASRRRRVDARRPAAGCCRAPSMPIDCASRRAGSMVSTTTLPAPLGGPQRERGGGGRLADAAGAAADDDAGARVVDQRVDVERRHRGARHERAHSRMGPRHDIPWSRQAAGQLVEAAQVDAVRPAGAARTSGTPSALTSLRWASSSARRIGVVARLVEQPVQQVVGHVHAGRARSAPIAARSSSPLRAAASVLDPQSRGRTRFTTTPPTGRPASRRSRSRRRSPGPASPRAR